MKKYLVLGLAITSVFILSNCSSTKKTTATEIPKSTYETHMTSVIMSHCSPCHIPEKGGNKRAYDNFANVKTDIDEMIRRIELNPGDRGFMPFKRAKLADSTISIFKQWKADGMLER
jgi:nitrate/TMAO reductase-like tetraheme cytochrome c subunit